MNATSMFFCRFLSFVFMLQTPWQSSRILICDRWKKFLEGNFDGKLKMVKKRGRNFWWKTQNGEKTCKEVLMENPKWWKNLEGKWDGNLTKGRKKQEGKKMEFLSMEKKDGSFFSLMQIFWVWPTVLEKYNCGTF